MARFQLKAKHYLNVTIPGRKIIWRYSEESRDGIANEQEFPVPLYLDPEDPRWHNDKELGIVVTTEADPAHPRDYILKGEPTIDMEPLDEEAEALRASLMPKWTNPIESLPAQLSPGEQAFMEAMMKQFAGVMNPQPQIDISLLTKRLDELEAQNKALQERLEEAKVNEVEVEPVATAKPSGSLRRA